MGGRRWRRQWHVPIASHRIQFSHQRKETARKQRVCPLPVPSSCRRAGSLVHGQLGASNGRTSERGSEEPTGTVLICRAVASPNKAAKDVVVLRLVDEGGNTHRLLRATGREKARKFGRGSAAHCAASTVQKRSRSGRGRSSHSSSSSIYGDKRTYS